jgi:peptidoglycan/LPS O-acetylase OafA/YrhL
MCFIVFIPRTIQIGMEWSLTLHSLYLTFSYFIFVFGLSLTILPTILGCKALLVNLLMDTEIFNFITKISFATYLIHQLLIKIWYAGQSYNTYYS